DAVEARDGAKRLGKMREGERLLAQTSLAQPREQQREERRVHLAHLGEVDGAHAVGEVAASLLEHRGGIGEGHRPGDHHARAVAADHLLAGAAASKLRFLALRFFTSPSMPESRTTL